MPRSRAVVVVLICGVLSACGDDASDGGRTSEPSAPTGTSTRVTVPPTPPATTTSAPPAIGSPSTAPVVVAATNRDVALLSAVRAARHPGFDRVVFEFRDQDTPGYDVRYVQRPVVQDGAGTEIAVQGEHVIQVRMENALDADLTRESAPATYTGPTRITPALPVVRQLVRTGGFEGVLTWAIGVDARAGYVVSALQDPPRLVVDVATG